MPSSHSVYGKNLPCQQNPRRCKAAYSLHHPTLKSTPCFVIVKCISKESFFRKLFPPERRRVWKIRKRISAFSSDVKYYLSYKIFCVLNIRAIRKHNAVEIHVVGGIWNIMCLLYTYSLKEVAQSGVRTGHCVVLRLNSVRYKKNMDHSQLSNCC